MNRNDAELIGVLRQRVEQHRACGDLVRARAFADAAERLRKRLEAIAGQERAADEQAARAALEAGPAGFVVTLPIYTVSEVNQRQHWGVKHKARGDIRPVVGMAMRAHARRAGFPLRPPCDVRLVRLAPVLLCVRSEMLDDDNLASALKAVRDGVADAFGSDDSARAGLRWSNEQEQRRAYGVRIECRRGAA